MREKTDPQPHDERAALIDRLRFQRQTVRKKAEGLSEADAHRAFLPSPLMTVAGLVSHLRWILLHLIEETARHNGHLDILREFADGVTGE